MRRLDVETLLHFCVGRIRDVQQYDADKRATPGWVHFCTHTVKAGSHWRSKAANAQRCGCYVRHMLTPLPLALVICGGVNSRVKRCAPP